MSSNWALGALYDVDDRPRGISNLRLIVTIIFGRRTRGYLSKYLTLPYLILDPCSPHQHAISERNGHIPTLLSKTNE